ATLPGTWQLQSRIQVTAAGERRAEPMLGEDPVALLIYDRSGNFSAQFMRRDRSAEVSRARRAKSEKQTTHGFEAYFGTYTIDDETGIVTQHLRGALSPENVGAAVTRAVEVEGDTLVIRLDAVATDGTPVTRTLTWRRVG